MNLHHTASQDRVDLTAKKQNRRNFGHSSENMGDPEEFRRKTIYFMKKKYKFLFNQMTYLNGKKEK